MKLSAGGHLTYCTNIHPGESWVEVFQSLKQNVPEVKKRVAPDKPFGVGLRLSNKASEELISQGVESFKNWMKDEDLYVFTMNGFPYGGFHHQVVKDRVHHPDWTTSERLHYTLRLFQLLGALLPSGISGGISTSPLTYRHWWDQGELHQVFEKATEHLVEVVEFLYGYWKKTGVVMHLDIEPEPDGLLENTSEFVAYFNDWLLPRGQVALAKSLDISPGEAREVILRHIQLCYDICHFAVGYEQPHEVMNSLKRSGIGIGKIQISAALKAEYSLGEDRSVFHQAFQSLDEPTYLHQVMARDQEGNLQAYQDLSQALRHIDEAEVIEWRTHFHVPVFVTSYGLLQSTREDIVSTLRLWKQQQMTQHLEVETYTWQVLPPELQQEITSSIARELNWVKQQLI
ncbi:MAG: metabolite traffic protein EboE [Cyclobacteriaceae bacterium]|nr:metabolite traffic protein EboE [Cyclobacteriaceae bacterium]